jgi:PAS domain S-box-containing protein
MLYEAAPVGYFIVDRDGRVIQSNPAGAALLGLPCGEIDGCPLASLLHPASRPLLDWQLKKLFNGSGAETCTVQTTGSHPATLRVFANLAPHAEVVLMILTAMESTST